ncbi:MAG: nitrous oxide reductase accessory protein NosL [Desulfobulbaceae bacterium]|jgi:copper chaperone NosL|nr:nitrous oxide reductase accessory protein NosL [Desulfobulbaceae bacterium]
MHAKVSILFFFSILCTLPSMLIAGEHTGQFNHPITTGEQYSQATHCPNCGMDINMWARTRHQFTIGTTSYETCSLRCLADTVLRAGEGPHAVQAGVYLDPKIMGEAVKGWYVIGSSAPGTMTHKSKLFFASKTKAEQFALNHGGTLTQFETALLQAQKELEPMRQMLQQKRQHMGKIATPDDTTACANCGMRPAQYPAFRSQVQVQGEGTLHFCSTKCLIKQKDSFAGKNSSAWVTVYPSGDIDFAEGLYYVIGSDVMGPMGSEALPFRKKQDGAEFIKKHGGTITTYTQLNPSMFNGKMHHKMH